MFKNCVLFFIILKSQYLNGIKNILVNLQYLMDIEYGKKKNEME